MRALELFQAPDADSGCEEEEGRRIVSLGGNDFQVVSYAYYRDLRRAEEKKEKTRKRVAKHRADPVDDSQCNAHVTPPYVYVSESVSSSGKNDRMKPPTLEEVEARVKEMGYEYVDAATFHAFYESKGWKVGKNPMKKWHAALGGWEARDKKNENKVEVKKAKRYEGRNPYVGKAKLDF